MSKFQLGIDRFLSSPALRKPLKGKRIALLHHAASATSSLISSSEALMSLPDLNIVCFFSPQHGYHSAKQDNMIESPHDVDPIYSIPIFSLYSQKRRPTPEMLAIFDTLVIDLQDIGSRVYTYLTTVFYMLQACAAFDKEVWILDRPNPAGRPIEGPILQEGWDSFIGPAQMIMRHGMTMGELATWYKHNQDLSITQRVIKMSNYHPDSKPGYGWPISNLSWINPSPNAANLYMTRCYPGIVLIEGTTLSEGRGTTHPLEILGAPDLDFKQILRVALEFAPEWVQGCQIRVCHFEPVFDKHAEKLCHGLQIHVDDLTYDHYTFKPFRLVCALLKAIRLGSPDYRLWNHDPFEYEYDRLAIDLLCGTDYIRKWVDDSKANKLNLQQRLINDERKWDKIRRPYLLY